MNARIPFLVALLASTMYSVFLLSPMALAQEDWLVGGWSYESEFRNYQHAVIDRKFGKANGGRSGRLIEIGPIQTTSPDAPRGTLQGFFRDDGATVWQFVYGDGSPGGCNAGATRPASVIVDTAHKKLKISIITYSGRMCDGGYPWTATLYHD